MQTIAFITIHRPGRSTVNILPPFSLSSPISENITLSLSPCLLENSRSLTQMASAKRNTSPFDEVGIQSWKRFE
ncbi:hypothetical protein Nepgr_007540 [Nepenthes gracilis]|uniref:Uncharacterized protein n=1 Tax=Nepenthes gracilis TaxID=150966 RepID=A0AAD3XIJ0_NEPGR|nr:hypothetical protein Nepgr_007540 [Nepenthes gracilis]